MTDFLIQNTFRRLQAHKGGSSGHVDYGYTHGIGQKIPQINVITNEFYDTSRQRRTTEWVPKCTLEHPKPWEISCYPIYLAHVGFIPNYGGHVPGFRFRFGRTYGDDTKDAKRWLKGDYRPN